MSAPITTGYSGDSGIYRRLQELHEATPFEAFYITMVGGKDFRVLRAQDLEFHVSGLPQVRSKSGGRWVTLNPDHILALTVGLKPPHHP
jgi:hypothetical protein